MIVTLIVMCCVCAVMCVDRVLFRGARTKNRRDRRGPRARERPLLNAERTYTEETHKHRWRLSFAKLTTFDLIDAGFFCLNIRNKTFFVLFFFYLPR